jgi:hypothetical protein
MKLKHYFALFLGEWLTVYALHTVKRSTYVSYEGYVRLHLAPELGSIKLNQLTTESIPDNSTEIVIRMPKTATSVREIPLFAEL